MNWFHRRTEVLAPGGGPVNLESATVSVPLATLDALRARAQAADVRAVEKPPIAVETEVILAPAVAIVSFFVASFHPNDVPRWPADDLRAFADVCERAGRAEHASVYRAFADKIDVYEAYRVRQKAARARGEPDPPLPPL